MSVADLTPRTPFRRMIGPVKISVTDFHTDLNNSNPHVFTGSTETGETFTWGGRFSTDPVGAVGELGVENVALTNFAALYQDFVSFEIRDGVASFHVNYEFLMSATTNIAAVSNASFTLKSFKLGVPGAEQNLVELPEFSVGGVSGEAFTRRGEVGSVRVRGANLNVNRAKGAEFNVVNAAQANTNASAPGGILVLMSVVTNAFAQLLNSTNLASAMVRDVAVMDALLGALSLGDIGKYFPPDDPQWKGADSLVLLEQVVGLVRERGWQVVNVDAVVIAERPRLRPHIEAMRALIAGQIGRAHV